jgi:hypothetical protein
MGGCRYPSGGFTDNGAALLAEESARTIWIVDDGATDLQLSSLGHADPRLSAKSALIRVSLSLTIEEHRREPEREF